MEKAPHGLRFELGVRLGARPLLGFESGERGDQSLLAVGGREDFVELGAAIAEEPERGTLRTQGS